MIKIRFELNSDAVFAILRACFSYLETAFEEGQITANKQTTLMDCNLILRKLKMYGQSAWINRETFREEMEQLKKMIEDAKNAK